MPCDSGDSVSTSLLVRARANDRRAWEKLADLFTPIVYNWVRRAGVPPADAEDVVQDVFLEVSRGLGRFRRDQPGDSFGGWVRVMTRRRVCDYRRRGAPLAVGGSDLRAALDRVPDAAPPDGDADPTDDPTADLLRGGLELIRAEFQARTWDAFQAVAVDERPAADVAADLGMSVGAVYMARSRVLRRLREELAGLV